MHLFISNWFTLKMESIWVHYGCLMLEETVKNPLDHTRILNLGATKLIVYVVHFQDTIANYLYHRHALSFYELLQTQRRVNILSVI